MMSNVRVVQTLKISCSLKSELLGFSFDLLTLFTTLKRLDLKQPAVEKHYLLAGSGLPSCPAVESID